ncbi:MAG TPA: ATP-binding protein [Candidatus Binatia bacterium]|nr:ATP-binding protein [Candidatus Binatia bacterium]
MTDRSIIASLLIVFLLLTLFITCVGALSMRAMYELNVAAKNIAAEQWTDVKLSREALDYSSRNTQINLRLFLGKDRSQCEALLAERDENSRKISGLLVQLETRVNSPAERDRLDALFEASRSYTASYQNATRLLLEGKLSTAQEYLINDTAPRFATYHASFRSYADFQTDEMNGQLDSSTAGYRSACKRVVVMTTLSILLALGLAAVVIRKIAHEMEHRQAAENELRELNARLEIRITERTASLEESNWHLAREMAERKQTERDLRFTRFSVESASDSVFWVDPQAHILYANEAACRALGRSRQELGCLSIPDIDPSFSKEKWQSLWEELKVCHSMNFEAQQRHKEGRIFPIEVTANRLEFDGQEYLFAFTRDISQRRMIQGQLQQAQKMESIGQLAAGIAHEINTPTQFVRDNLTFLRDSWKCIREMLDLYRSFIRDHATPAPGSRNEAIQQAEHKCDFEFILTEAPRAIEQGLDGVRRVAEIVRAMKAFSHPDSAEKTSCNLNQTIQSTITVARNEWKYVADVVTDFDDSLPPVVCYPGDINQVVLNLLVNAAHAIQDRLKDSKGLIQVRTRKEGDLAVISITDNGTGVAEEIRSRIFDPFFTTKEVGKGTGQGLSMAYAIVVKRHGGKLHFKSEVGRGTTFFIEIPIDACDRSTNGAARLRPAPHDQTGVRSRSLNNVGQRHASQLAGPALWVKQNPGMAHQPPYCRTPSTSCSAQTAMP